MRHLRGARCGFAITACLRHLSGLLLATAVLIPTTSSSAGPPSVAALPMAVVPPPNKGNGVPFDGNPILEASGASIDFAAHGYVEQEFFVTGTANVYQYGSAAWK